MFEGLIEQLILSYLGDYIENLDRNKLSLGLWSGALILENIHIKKKTVNDLKLPFKLIYGIIKKLTLNINWKSNFTTPTEIIIDEITIVINLLNQENWEILDYTSYEYKINELIKYSNKKYLNLIENFNNNNKEKTNQSSSYTQRVLLRIMDNLHLTIKNVNIRIQENNNNNNFIFGISLKEILILNTNENYEISFIDRNVDKNADLYKKLEIKDFGIYLNLNNDQKNFLKDSDDLEESLKNFNIEQKYLIQPLNLIIKYKQINNIKENTINEAKMNIFIDLPYFYIELHKNQYDIIIKMLTLISKYQKFQNNFYEQRKLNYFKPNHKKKDIYWFKFAIESVIKYIKYYKGDKRMFNLPEFAMKDYKTNYIEIFETYFKLIKSNKEVNLEKNKKDFFEKIIYIIDLNILKKWSNEVIEKVFRDEKIEEKKYNSQSYFSYFFGYKNDIKIDEKTFFNEEEQKQLYEILHGNKDEEENLNENFENNISLKFFLNKGKITCIKNLNHTKNILIESFDIIYHQLNFNFKINYIKQIYNIE